MKKKLKIVVNSEAEFLQAEQAFFKLGYQSEKSQSSFCRVSPLTNRAYIYASKSGGILVNLHSKDMGSLPITDKELRKYYNQNNFKEVNLAELLRMVHVKSGMVVNVDWSQAPANTLAYAQDSFCASWFQDIPQFVSGFWEGQSLGQALSFGYTGNLSESLVLRPLGDQHIGDKPQNITALHVKEKKIHDLPDQVTLCVLILENGFKVTGLNCASVSPDKFDRKIAHEIAYKDAEAKLLTMEAFLKQEHCYQLQKISAEMFEKT